MKPSDILFSVNEYDKDGDITERGIFLHFGETRVKAAENLEEFRSIYNQIANIIDEIEKNYPDDEEPPDINHR